LRDFFEDGGVGFEGDLAVFIRCGALHVCTQGVSAIVAASGGQHANEVLEFVAPIQDLRLQGLKLLALSHTGF